jgi:hypothetical protein
VCLQHPRLTRVGRWGQFHRVESRQDSLACSCFAHFDVVILSQEGFQLAMGMTLTERTARTYAHACVRGDVHCHGGHHHHAAVIGFCLCLLRECTLSADQCLL